MVTYLKRALRSLHSKWFLTDSHIAFSANIDTDSVIGENAKIAEGCKVEKSVLGKNVMLSKGCDVTNSRLEDYVALYADCLVKNAEIGSYCYMARKAILYNTKVGRFCSFGPYLIGGFGEHPVSYVSTSPVFYSTRKQCGVSFVEDKSFEENKEINIGHDVWVGARVFIRDGIKIGNGAIVGAGAVVVKDVPDFAIVGGVPAKIIRFRFEKSVIEELLQIQWWNWSEETLKNATEYIAQGDIESFLKWYKSYT